MVAINLQIPEDVKATLERRAAEQGLSSVEAYIEALVQEDAVCPEYGGPAAVSFTSHTDFEARVLEGLDAPGREMTDADWDQMKARFLERQGRKESR